MAEREGFEPSKAFTPYTLSKRARSTTLPPLRISVFDGGNPPSRTSAPESTVTVAPFRAWRGSQFIAARGPKWVTIAARMLAESLGECEPIQLFDFISRKSFRHVLRSFGPQSKTPFSASAPAKRPPPLSSKVALARLEAFWVQHFIRPQLDTLGRHSMIMKLRGF